MSIFSDAINAIFDDRFKTHGDFGRQHERAAALWTAYLNGKQEVSAHDVAVMMVLLKISRIREGGHSHDHYVDMAGYTFIAHKLKESSSDDVPEEPEDRPDN
jgi:predicted nucleic acid-binding protein